MKNLISLLFLLLPSFNINAQWYPQNSNVWSNIYSVFSIDGQTAWISGQYGTILKTTNSGASWIQKNSGVSGTLGYIYFFNENEGIAAGNNGTIIRTTDGGNSWDYVSSGTYENLNDGAFVNDSLMFVIGWNGILLKTTDKGITWSLKPQISNSNYHWVQFWDENLGWASTWFNGQIWKTTDGGNTWTMKIQMGSLSLWQVQFITPLKGVAVGENGVIIKTSDGGENWTQYFAGTSENLHAITFNTQDVGWIVGKDENILRTTDSGDSWSLVHAGNDYEYLQVYFYDENIGWILGTPGFWSGYPSAILYTDNGGYLVPVEMTSFLVEINNQNNVEINWATASETNNYGFEVQKLKTEAQNSQWEVLGFVSGHGTTTEPKYYSFIDENIQAGNYKFRLKQIDYDGHFEFSNEVELQVTLPIEFLLEQNYPNPFNPSTTIRFSVPNRDNVCIKIYNPMGELIETLLNDIREPGNYEVIFKSGNLSSGVYFYQIISGRFSDIKKMIVLK